MNWWKHFRPKACSVDLKSESKSDTLSEIVHNMVSGGILAEESEAPAVKALLEREQLASTGVGAGVAIPHVKLKGIDGAVCSLSIHRPGLEWAAVDGAPVHILFAVLRPAEAGPNHDPEQHLEMMRWIAGLARESDFRAFALLAAKKSDLIGLLKEMSPA